MRRRRKPAQPKWIRNHGKLWLVYDLAGQRYEIPLDETTRYVDGMVLFNSIKRPGLVKGFAEPSYHLDGLRKLAATDLDARNAYAALEAYQWDQLKEAGVPVNYATEKREPTIVDRTDHHAGDTR